MTNLSQLTSLLHQRAFKLVLNSPTLSLLGIVILSTPLAAQTELPPPTVSIQFGSRPGDGPERPLDRGGRPRDGRHRGPRRSGNTTTTVLNSVYSLSDGSTKTEKGRTFTSQNPDVSAIYVAKGSKLQLVKPVITTSSTSSSSSSSKFLGLNSGVVASALSQVAIEQGKIVTRGSNATGLFVEGYGAKGIVKGGSIETSGAGSHGAVALRGASLSLDNVTIKSTGVWAAPLLTDLGTGTIDMVGGTVMSSNTTSPGIYSTSAVTVKKAKVSAAKSEGAVIDGKASIVLTDSALSGGRVGAMIFCSVPIDTQTTQGTFTMRGGSLHAASGPLFYVNNTKALISLTGVKVNAAAGTLLDASAGQWGRPGANGGQVFLSVAQQNLNGDLRSDALSSISATLSDKSTLTGGIQKVSLTLDATSRWNVTKDSSLITLSGAIVKDNGSIGNIKGNGHTVTYDAAQEGNRALGGKTYDLANGGQLRPQ